MGCSFRLLVFWEEEQIIKRNQLIDTLSSNINIFLRQQNRAFKMLRIEAPLLTPHQFLNKNYGKEDVFFIEDHDFLLRPETTPGSYEYAKHIMNDTMPESIMNV